MSKITFRADDALVERLEALDASKSEVMREALREFLDRHPRTGTRRRPDDAEPSPRGGTLDDALAARIDELLDDRLDALLDERLGGATRQSAPDVNVNVSLDGVRADSTTATEATSPVPSDERVGHTDTDHAADHNADDCGQCGESLSDDHVYCPNCGEKRTHRAFCECGDEVRTDWAFCPGCGRRTPAADVLDRP